MISRLEENENAEENEEVGQLGGDMFVDIAVTIFYCSESARPNKVCKN